MQTRPNTRPAQLGVRRHLPASPGTAESRSLVELARAINLDVAFDEAAMGMSIVSLDGRWVRVNETLCEILGRPSSDIVGRSYQELTAEEDLEVGKPFLLARGGSGADPPDPPGRIEKRYVRPDGTVVTAEVTTKLIRDGAGVALGYFSQTLDITERRRLEDALRTERDRFGAIFDNSPVPVVEIDTSGRVLLWNKAAEAVGGWSAQELVGHKLPSVAPEDWDHFVSMLHQAATGHPVAPYEVTGVRSDGEPLELLVSCTGVPAPGAALAESVVLVSMDITERKHMEQALFHQAYFDALTGLPNRAHLVEHLAGSPPKAPGGASGPLGLVRICVEGLGAINDTLGESAGDAILAEAAGRLRASVREVDVVARLGGDDFAVLLKGVSRGAPARIAAELTRALEQPMNLAGRERVVRAVAGVAWHPGGTSGPVPDPEELLREADLAMDAARSSQAANVAVFGEDMRRAVFARLELVEDLRQALEAGALEVAYQPIVELGSRKLRGAEALVRWKHPRLGPIAPERFVSLAEGAGLIRDLGRFVLEAACAQAASWPDHGGGAPEIHVNLSAAELADPGLRRDVAAALDQSGLDPRRLVLELTESMLVGDATAVLERLESLKSLGTKLSLDDFGTGYSSLAYLVRLPVDEIKLDRSFVQDIHLAGRRRRGLVAVVVHLAETFALELVAEGIERPGELEVLVEEGCALGQGYLLGRPMPGPAFAEMLDSQHPLLSIVAPDGDRRRRSKGSTSP